MRSRFNRRSYLTRLGASAGVGALAIITGACSENAGTDSDVVPAANSGSEAAAESQAASTDTDANGAEAPAASTDGEGSTDGQAPAPGTEDEGSVDSDQSSESY